MIVEACVRSTVERAGEAVLLGHGRAHPTRQAGLDALAARRYPTRMTRNEAILAALAEAGLEDHLASSVDEQLDAPEEAWPTCCDSGCEPCVATVNQATRRARALLGLAAPT